MAFAIPHCCHQLVCQFGGELGDPQAGFLPEREVMMEAFNFLKSLYLADESWSGIEANAYRYFSNRYALAYEGSLSDLKYTNAYQNSGSFQDEWTTLPYFDDQGANLIGVGLIILRDL